MSINNVVFSKGSLPFELSPDEKVLYKLPTVRQQLSVKSKAQFGTTSISCDDGEVVVTNKRLVFATATSGDINAFVVDLNLAGLLQFSHQLVQPWFGANYWKFMFFSAKEPAIASDGFPKEMWYTGSIQFNDGGLFDFVKALNQAITDSQHNREIDEELPRYSE